MGHSAAVWDYKAANEVIKDQNGSDMVVLWNLKGLQHGLVCMEDRSLHGGTPEVMNSYSPVGSFEFRLRVSLALDGNLNMISRIRNIDSKPFSFSFAYLTYLLVSDISEVRIEGLETLDYIDYLSERKRFTEQGDAITFESEVDRAYLRSPNCIAVLDHEKKRTFIIRKEGLPDAVVWNPWEKKSKSMADFGDVEYKKMVCVDGAAIERPITLKPGEEWTCRLELAVVPSSFCSENFDSSLRHF